VTGRPAGLVWGPRTAAASAHIAPRILAAAVRASLPAQLGLGHLSEHWRAATVPPASVTYTAADWIGVCALGALSAATAL
jgi:hypothetical protein